MSYISILFNIDEYFMSHDYSFTKKPMEDWTSEELFNAFMWDLIDKSDYDDECHRRGSGAGPSIKRLEEISHQLLQQQDALTPPSACCSQCGQAGHSIAGQKIVYASFNKGNKAPGGKSADGTVAWICAECAGRTCSVCGSPHQLLMGLDLIDDKGVIGHMAIFPVAPGCINTECEKHRRTAPE